MDDEPIEERKAPESWRDYLKTTAATTEVLRWVWREVMTREARRWLGRMTAGLIAATAFQIAQPRLATFVLDGLMAHSARSIIIGLAGILGCLLAGRILESFQSSAREWVIGLTLGALDRRITELYFEKSMGQHIHQSAALSTANMTKGRERFMDLHLMFLFEGIPVLLTFAFSYLMIWYLSSIAGLIMSVVIATYCGWMLYLNRKVVEVYSPIDAELRRVNRYRLERWEKFERVATSAMERNELGHLTAWFDGTITEDRNFWLWFIRQCTWRALVNVAGLVAVMAYGAWLVWTGEWSIGLLYPLYSWTSRVSEDIWRIGHIEHQLNWNMPTIRAMIRALSMPPDVVDHPDAIALEPDTPIAIEFRDVSHTYPLETAEEATEHGNGSGGEHVRVPVLRNVQFSVAAGERVALIGPSGAGKTTIMRLLLRYMNPDAGKILLNGAPLSSIKRASWIAALSYIPQHSLVFDGTLRYNLTYTLPEEIRRTTSDEGLWRLMRLLKIDFGDRLTNGLETLVGRNGIKLSGGQAQRLMIGAAAIKRPRFMIIDEATSHLDSTTERAVQAGLAEVLRGGVSALVVAHRLSTVRTLCNRFVVLRNPDDVPGGESQIEAVATSFEELYRVSPTFRRLADDQGISM